MTTTEVIVIVFLAVIVAMMIMAYITLIAAYKYGRYIERKWLGLEEEYMRRETENGLRRSCEEREEGQKQPEEEFLRFKCKRDKDSWLLSLAPPEPDGKADKNTKVLKAKLQSPRQTRTRVVEERHHAKGIKAQKRSSTEKHGE